MSYVLEHQEEARRLEYQSTLSNYRLQKEFEEMDIRPGSKVLDAGCGSGLISRYLVENFPSICVDACDFSKTRIEQAQQLARAYDRPEYNDITFFQSPLENIARDNESYDYLVCRFVLEHVSDPFVVGKEFFRIMKKGGRVCIVDVDGAIVNLYSPNKILMEQLSKVASNWHADMMIGRKLPHILKDSGFKNIQWQIQSIVFKGEDLIAEQELMRQRFTFVRPSICNILGSEREADLFIHLYLEEMVKEECTLVANKFIVYADKASSLELA